MEFKEFKDWVDGFKQKVEELLASQDLEALESTLKTLEEKTYEPSFWDDKDAAQVTIQKLNDLKTKYAESEA